MRFAWVLCVTSLCAHALDLRNSLAPLPGNATPRERAAIAMLTDEILKRTQIQLGEFGARVTSRPDIVIRRGKGPAEGYRVFVQRNAVIVEGNDERGVLFGIGRLLREM
ncbi:MAG TPA: hypothetical protein VGP79_02440, partial [Bryobacteraceae bacterium]|nr:hypothetical protein [Bryobacteraceae bacterium]